MTTSKKKRMSMLDTLASAGAATTTPSMMTSNRALRSARDAVDSHRVWELDPNQVSNHRVEDRLNPEDTADLQDAIETNGQTVPILVRRDPAHDDRYLLVYGRRRLEAIRNSDKVTKVRAIVANMNDDQSTRAQISENMARRDLTFIEKALFARELIDQGFGNQSQVADVLTVAKSAISMALAIVDTVTPELIRAIGPAQGIGRPRWDALAKAIAERSANIPLLIEKAERVYIDADLAHVEGRPPENADTSAAAFQAVEAALPPAPSDATQTPSKRSTAKSRALKVEGTQTGTVKRTAKGLTIDLVQGDFADWVEHQAQDLITDLHRRWQQQR